MAKTKDYCLEFSEIIENVGMNSAYVGDRFVGDEGAYARISTTSGDAEMMKAHWMDCRSAVTSVLKPFITSIIWNETDCSISCEFPDRVPQESVDSIEQLLSSFVVSYMLSKWYVITNKEGAEAEALVAKGYLEGIREAAYSRERPSRTSINKNK